MPPPSPSPLVWCGQTRAPPALAPAAAAACSITKQTGVHSSGVGSAAEAGAAGSDVAEGDAAEADAARTSGAVIPAPNDVAGGSSTAPAAAAPVAAVTASDSDSTVQPSITLAAAMLQVQVGEASSHQTSALAPSPLPKVGQGYHGSLSKRTRFSHDTLTGLVEAFQRNPFPDAAERKQLATGLGISIKSIHIWFQNQRQRSPLKAPPLPSLSSATAELPPLQAVAEPVAAAGGPGDGREIAGATLPFEEAFFEQMAFQA